MRSNQPACVADEVGRIYSFTGRCKKEDGCEPVHFIIWLSVGAIIGWLASRMFEAENRRTYKRTRQASAHAAQNPCCLSINFKRGSA
jgi:hypothetical protein